MFEWNGLKVPVYPKKERADWMLTDACCPGNNAEIKCGHGKELTCEDCIYARHHQEVRRRFYEECYDKPKVQTLFEGLVVPFPPKKEWTWMCSNSSCNTPMRECDCIGVSCGACIYDRRKLDRRKAFYEYHFGVKLTQEAFNRPDCPEWAQWAAVDEDGKAYWYSEKPEPKGTQWYRCAQNSGRYQQIENSTRTKFDASDWQDSLIKRPAKELPKLTVEVFNRPDCPEWAQWAAVDGSGKAYWYRYKPRLLEGGSPEWACWAAEDFGDYVLIEQSFDASDWEHSLIERPQKELPELTQTAFHCPDCPKEAAKLKVFPANRVVALDKDDKVLSVMELQCKEGEINRFQDDWYYDYRSNQLYHVPDQCCLPITAKPAKVTFLSAEELVGKAVTDQLTGKTVVITHVGDGEVDIVGVIGSDIMSMVTLVTRYRFTANGGFCCAVDTHAVN